MATLSKSYAGKRVLVTGHTGFKGSWLCEWLLALGADVWGFSLPPATKPALFSQLGLAKRLKHGLGDVRDAPAVTRVVAAARPDYIFHLAAQPIVRAAHGNPSETWAVNVMGTVNLLDSLRTLSRPCAAVIVTTDKVYQASSHAHPESDPTGANDPYGGSKAAVELAVETWRRTYFPLVGANSPRIPRVALATARSGNVIGGGDWATDRLFPDCVRSLSRGRSIQVRSPSSVRPWQHVLDPLAGYLLLAAGLRSALTSRQSRRLGELSGSFNFGPAAADQRSVQKAVEEILKSWPGSWARSPQKGALQETPVLRLDSRKAGRLLGWRPRWAFPVAVEKTVSWYRHASRPSRALDITRRHLAEFSAK